MTIEHQTMFLPFKEAEKWAKNPEGRARFIRTAPTVWIAGLDHEIDRGDHIEVSKRQALEYLKRAQRPWGTDEKEIESIRVSITSSIIFFG